VPPPQTHVIDICPPAEPQSQSPPELAAPSQVQPETSPPARKKSPRRKKPSRRSRPATEARDPHERNCTICSHPDRDAIEEEFVHWHNPTDIGREYEVGYRAVYRHAHARGLFAVRERNMRFALGRIIERASGVRASADSVLRAIRAYGCLNSKGQWIEPPAHVIVSSGSAVLASGAGVLPAGSDLPIKAVQRLLQSSLSTVESPELPVTG